jgi:hypothetical protein
MKTSRLMRSAVAAALVASLAVPAIAMAAGPFGQGNGNGNGNGGGKPKGAGQGQQVQAQGQNQAQSQVQNQARNDRLRENLRNRIERTLRQRKAKFDRAEARLERRIARLTEIADKAVANGVDVAAAKTALGKATDQLAVAAAEELKAQELFKAVLDASDKRAAFAAARAQAKVAQKALQLARRDVVSALQMLHKAIDASKTTTP